MAIHKLIIDEFDEIDYELIAIHTNLEDYRLAYFINQQLSTNLSKSENEIHIQLKNGETQFSRFFYYDEEKCISWNLIQNKNEVIVPKKSKNQDLFSIHIPDEAIKVFLLSELKKVDFFLKIENDNEKANVSEIMTGLKAIKNITMAYSIDVTTIKSKNNLIF